MIIPINIIYSPTCPQWRLMICIAIDNGSNNTVREIVTLLIKL